MSLLARKNLFAMPGDVSPVESWDERRMAVTAIWSTPVIDSDGDILDPLGFDLSLHKTNPIILFQHDTNRPVAKAISPESLYSVEQSEQHLKGTAFFTDKNQQSYEVFSLYAEGILRGWSVGFNVIEAERLEQANALGRRGSRVKRSILVECSAVAIGANQEALTINVQKGRVKSPELLQAVEPFLLKTRMWSTNMSIAAPPIGAPETVVLQAVLMPKAKQANPAAFKTWCQEQGYQLLEVGVSTVQVPTVGDCLAGTLVPAAKCDSGTIQPIGETGALGMYCKLKKEADDDANNNGIPDDQEMNPIKGAMYKRIKMGCEKLKKAMGDMQDGDLKSACKELTDSLEEALEAMMEEPDDDEEDDEEKEDEPEDDEDMTDEEAEKALAEVEAKIQELHQAEQQLAALGAK